MRARTLRLLVGCGVLFAGAGLTAVALPASAAGTFNVRDYGAKGDGSTIDSPAINKAIAAATAAGGGTVTFPAGTYQSRSIHLASGVGLQLASGATIRAASSGFDAAEANSFSQYQDYGHSHFHDALMWGDGVHDVAITGSGTIDGVGLTTDNSVPSGVGDKALSLKLCDHITVSGVTFKRAGHFAVLFNGCHDLTFDHIKILTTADRDGINVVNSWNVDIGNSDIESVDDAVVLKSDFALGQTFASHDIHVHDSTILSTVNNALQFGSETCGDFHDVTFDHLTITGAGKAGIGMVTQDGATIERVGYSDITMTKTAIPIYLKIGDRHSCPNSPPPGHIRDITITNVTGTGLVSPVSGAPEFTSTISGGAGRRVENVTLTNVKLTVPGGHPASDANIVPPENNTEHAPRILGTRPAYGFWLRHVSGVSFVDCQVRFDSNDGRPAFITDDASTVTLDGVTAQRGSSSAYDVGFSGTAGYRVANSQNTTGGTLRVKATDSTPIPTGTPETAFAEAESGTVTAPMQVRTDAAASGGAFVTVAAGNNSTSAAPAGGSTVLPVSVTQAGSYQLWGRIVDPTDKDDSFWVRVDAGAFVSVNNLPLGTGWHWATLGAAVNLSAGAHTITIAYREDGAELDRVAVSDDPAFTGG